MILELFQPLRQFVGEVVRKATETTSLDVADGWLRTLCSTTAPHKRKYVVIRKEDDVVRADIGDILTSEGFEARIHRPTPKEGQLSEQPDCVRCLPAEEEEALDRLLRKKINERGRTIGIGRQSEFGTFTCHSERVDAQSPSPYHVCVTAYFYRREEEQVIVLHLNHFDLQ